MVCLRHIKKAPEKFVDTNCILSENLRKIRINDEACDIKVSSSHGNCLFNAMKQYDVAIKSGRKHHKLINRAKILKNDIRNLHQNAMKQLLLTLCMQRLSIHLQNFKLLMDLNYLHLMM